MNPDAQDHADALEPGQEAPPPACVMTFNVSDASGAGGVAGDVATIAAMGAHPLPVVTTLLMRDTAAEDLRLAKQAVLEITEGAP